MADKIVITPKGRKVSIPDEADDATVAAIIDQVDAVPDEPAVKPELARIAARAAATAGGGMVMPMDIPASDQRQGVAGNLAIASTLIPFANVATAPQKALAAAKAVKDIAIPLGVGTGVYRGAKAIGAPEWLAGQLATVAGFAGGGRGVIRRLLARPGVAAAEEAAAAGARIPGMTSSGVPPRAPVTPTPTEMPVPIPARPFPAPSSGSGIPSPRPVVPAPTTLSVPAPTPKPRLTPQQSLLYLESVKAGKTPAQALREALLAALTGDVK